jgi:hypothetical protein
LHYYYDQEEVVVMGLLGGKKNADVARCEVCGKPIKGKLRGGKKGNMHPNCIKFAASEYKSIHDS